MSEVSKSFVSAVTTPPNAAPITTPTAISTTFPRRMNFLNPSSITVPLRNGCGQCKSGRAGGQAKEYHVPKLRKNWKETIVGSAVKQSPVKNKKATGQEPTSHR